MAKKKKEAANVVTGPSRFDEKRWETEEDLRAVGCAHAVRKDPDRMKRVKKLAADKLEENKRRLEEAEHLVDLGEGKKESEEE